MKRIIIAAIATLALSLGAQAQRQEYAYRHALDLRAGYVGRVFRLYGAEGSTPCVSDGSNWAIRYTFYPWDHWGFYASAALNWTDMDDESAYLDKIVSISDRSYAYFPSNGRWDMEDLFNASLVAGGAYRYDFGQWSLRPRVGLGYANMMQPHSNVFYRVDKTDHGARPEALFSSMEDSRCFMFQTGVQLTYTICNHFYFSLDAEINGFPSQTGFYENVRETYLCDEHSYGDRLESIRPVYVPGESISKETFQRSPGLCWNISFGIGWNIGWNRNEPRY